METCLNYTDTDDGCMYISSDEKKVINRILKLKEQHPADVEITKRPENNDGCLYAVIPAKWLRISPPRVNNLTEEQRRATAERLSAYRKKKG